MATALIGFLVFGACLHVLFGYIAIVEEYFGR